MGRSHTACVFSCQIRRGKDSGQRRQLYLTHPQFQNFNFFCCAHKNVRSVVNHRLGSDNPKHTRIHRIVLCFLLLRCFFDVSEFLRNDDHMPPSFPLFLYSGDLGDPFRCIWYIFPRVEGPHSYPFPCSSVFWSQTTCACARRSTHGGLRSYRPFFLFRFPSVYLFFSLKNTHKKVSPTKLK